jgi:chitodextrinase
LPGSTETNAGGNDAFVAKYDATGARQWVHQLGTAFSDQGAGIAVDGSGNTFVTGYTSGTLPGSADPTAGGSDVFVANYDTAGNMLAVNQLGSSGSDEGTGAAVDASGHTYVTGYTYGTLPGATETNAGSSDIFITRLGPSIPLAPAAPTAVSAASAPESASVSWTAAADNGSPIIGYTVTASPGGETSTVDGTQTTATVTGLTNGTSYTFTVTATNAIGTSSPSAASNPVVPADVPDPPTGVAATAGPGSAFVTWVAPAANGGTITSYTATASPGGASATVDGTRTTTTVTGLSSDTAYTFTVTATSGSGTGSASSPSNTVTPLPPTAPDAASGV